MSLTTKKVPDYPSQDASQLALYFNKMYLKDAGFNTTAIDLIKLTQVREGGRERRAPAALRPGRPARVDAMGMSCHVIPPPPSALVRVSDCWRQRTRRPLCCSDQIALHYMHDA